MNNSYAINSEDVSLEVEPLVRANPNKESVLIVDDNDFNLFTLSQILTSLFSNLEIVTGYNGVEAVNSVKSGTK